jgi:polynucleotide 5'-kinase involved in rRNA processing
MIDLEKIGKFSDIPEVSEDWKKVIERIRERERVLVLGETDSGKTSFCIAVEKLKKNVATVDLDPGQQRFFIPGCVSLKLKGKIFKFFIGSTTPRFSEWMILLAISTFLQKLKGHKGPIIFDMPGYIKEDRALMLILAKIKLIKPHKIIIFKSPETERIKNFSAKFSEIIEINPNEKTRKISPEERARIREEKIKLYFSQYKKISVPKTKIINLSYYNENFQDFLGFFRNWLTEFIGVVLQEDQDNLLVAVPQNFKDKKWDFILKSPMKIKIDFDGQERRN